MSRLQNMALSLRQYCKPPKRFSLFQQNLPSGHVIFSPQWAQRSRLAGGSPV
jgi:hypothetical protein